MSIWIDFGYGIGVGNSAGIEIGINASF